MIEMIIILRVILTPVLEKVEPGLDLPRLLTQALGLEKLGVAFSLVVMNH